MPSYSGYIALLNGRDSKKLANNTYLRLQDGVCVIRLHNTDIIKVRSDNSWELNTGGWQTVTTKSRINEFSPARIHQNRGIWYLGSSDIPFYDGIVIDSTGEPIDPPADCNEVVKRKNYLDKEVKKFVDGYVKYALENGVAFDNGDCWFCLFGASSGFDHVWSHVKERYYFGSFVKTAVNLAKSGNMIWLDMIRADLQRKEKSDKERSRVLREVLTSYFKKAKPKMLEFVEIPEELSV